VAQSRASRFHLLSNKADQLGHDGLSAGFILHQEGFSLPDRQVFRFDVALLTLLAGSGTRVTAPVATFGSTP